MTPYEIDKAVNIVKQFQLINNMSLYSAVTHSKNIAIIYNGQTMFFTCIFALESFLETITVKGGDYLN